MMNDARLHSNGHGIYASWMGMSILSLERGWWTLATTTVLRVNQTNYAAYVAQSKSVYCGIVVVDNVLENVVEGEVCAHVQNAL